MNVFISNTGVNVSEQNIKNLFSEFGSVISVFFKRSRNDKSRFWWVIMTEQSDANNAILTLNGSIYQNNKITVSRASLRDKIHS